MAISAAGTTPSPAELQRLTKAFHHDFQRFMMEYQFAVDEVLTKVSILREEFLYLHKYNPIEHVSSRVKTPESIMRKVARRNIAPSLTAIRENLSDIAGVRITCSFVKDIYKVLNTLTAQNDLKVIQIKDYIKNPKPSGYKSVHAIVQIPVFLSDGPVDVVVELQIRTIAQDFWASLEHKIFYKYEGEVPEHLVQELADAAAVATKLDMQMQRLHTEVHGHDANDQAGHEATFDTKAFQGLLSLAQQASTRSPEKCADN
ncbi:GTP pyrophosphokinase [Glutamicibacter nicotianae]|uniref:GTP pyrophosphokinase n=1 Tax=Glutamicibacter nicotianae TaxID=37929 RepID=UPI00255355FA|nr:GTP pyrophosphokinase family protein [Glutamicibacter nicotianae]WIV43043.1 GTP pyrophosphokinase family protein [Glutamicibacter nicotianae]